jgi:hypothetical protein
MYRRFNSTNNRLNRTGFISSLAAFTFLPKMVFAANPLTIVCVSCDDTDLAEHAEDQLSGALVDRGVKVADPSAIQTRYHEEGRAAVAAIWGDGWGVAAMEWSSVSWVETVYNARRLFAAKLILSDFSEPYGQYEVHKIKTRLSYKCFDVSSHQIIAAGSSKGEAVGEDVSDITDDALNDAIKNIASNAAYRMKA